MLYVYIGCLTFGGVYSILSLLLGGHGVDHGADAGLDHGADHGDLPSPFNPLVIASAITTFGAAGLIGTLGLGFGNILSLFFALGLAGVVGAAIFFGVVKLMYGEESDSTFSQNDLIGVEAEVITPVPKNGLGEVVCSIRGIRYNLTAKNDCEESIQKGEKVRIKEVENNTAIITKKMTLDDLEYLDEKPIDKDINFFS